MALNEWKNFMIDAGLSEETAAKYAATLVSNDMIPATAEQLDRDILDEMGIKSIGHALAILKHAKKHHEPDAKPATQHKQPPAAKAAKAPTLMADRTRPQFRKFKIDWGVYHELIGIPKE